MRLGSCKRRGFGGERERDCGVGATRASRFAGLGQSMPGGGLALEGLQGWDVGVWQRGGGEDCSDQWRLHLQAPMASQCWQHQEPCPALRRPTLDFLTAPAQLPPASQPPAPASLALHLTSPRACDSVVFPGSLPVPPTDSPSRPEAWRAHSLRPPRAPKAAVCPCISSLSGSHQRHQHLDRGPSRLAVGTC